MQEPTAYQCNANEQVSDVEGNPAFASWYPATVGNVSKAIVVLHDDGSFVAFVWSDWDFPYSCGGCGPVEIHHRDPRQFIDFGQAVANKQLDSKLLMAGCEIGWMPDV